MSIKDKRVGFLGAGNMGEAMIKGLTQAGLVPAAAIAATDVRADRLQQIAKQYGIRAASFTRPPRSMTPNIVQGLIASLRTPKRSRRLGIIILSNFWIHSTPTTARI